MTLEVHIITNSSSSISHSGTHLTVVVCCDAELTVSGPQTPACCTVCRQVSTQYHYTRLWQLINLTNTATRAAAAATATATTTTTTTTLDVSVYQSIYLRLLKVRVSQVSQGRTSGNCQCEIIYWLNGNSVKSLKKKLCRAIAHDQTGVSEWVNEWVSGWVSEWVSEWVLASKDTRWVVAYCVSYEPTKTHTHKHSVLTAMFPGEPGLAGCPLNSLSPFIPGLCILLGQT